VKALHTFGIKRSGAYVVVETDGEVIVVRWRDRGRRKAQSFPVGAVGKRTAKAFAQGTYDRLSAGVTAGVARITLADLHARYVAGKSAKWRPMTARNEMARWGYFVHRVAPTTFADLVTPETLDEVSGFLMKHGGKKARGLAPNQVRGILSNACRVFRWAKRRNLLDVNRLADYEIPLGKDDRTADVDEFPPAEAAAIIARLGAKDSRRWRGHVAVRIAATQGPRVRALLLSENGDYDLAARTVRWRREHDKLGRERLQPLTRDAAAAVRIARIWHRRLGYVGRFLIPAARELRRDADQPWTYQALHQLLKTAQREADIPLRPLRAMHGFRRMAAGTVADLTGNPNAAAEWIGDTDLRTVKKSYLKERPEALMRTAALIRMPTEAENPTSTERQPSPKRGR
jgi:hypothetical protein